MEDKTGMMVIGAIVLIMLSAGITYVVINSKAVKIDDKTPTISVMGEATRKVMPDQFVLNFNVAGNGTTSAISTAEAAKNLAAAKAALMAAGVSEKDLETVSFYTNPLYNTSRKCPVIYYAGVSDSNAAYAVTEPATTDSKMIMPGPQPPCEYSDEIIGYQTVHSISVKSTNINNAGKLVDAVASSAGTSVTYTYFTLSQEAQKTYQDQLQADAAADAKKKAEKLASSVGASVGKIVSLNPSGYYYPTFAAKDSMDIGESMPPIPTELYPTETTLYGQITIVYELKQ